MGILDHAQASGKLPDMLLDVSKAEQSVSFIINRTRQIKSVCEIHLMEERIYTSIGFMF